MALRLLCSIYQHRLEVGDEILARTPTRFRGVAVVHGLVITSILVTFFVVFHHYHGINLFSFHPTFMTLGFAFCISEGILSYRNELVSKREEKKCAVRLL